MGLFTIRQTVPVIRKGAETVKHAAYEKKLEEYKRMLEAYKENLTSYEMKLRSFDSTEEDHMAAVQVALDLTYIKEELDELKLNQDNGMKEQEDLILKVARMDSAIVEPIKRSSFENKSEIINRVDTVLQELQKTHKGLKLGLCFSLFLNLVTISGVVVIILNLFS